MINSSGNVVVRNVLLGILFTILLIPVTAKAQNQRTVTGTVTDETGEPLIGAMVKITDQNIGTVTDIDGNFTLNVGANAKSLTVSYVGYMATTVAITPGDMKITLRSNSELLDEVVVIGYGVSKKEDLTGSVSAIDEKDFNQGVISSPEELINGKVAGVQIVNTGGSPTAGSTIRIRGGASLNASNDPLIVLDGVPMEVGGSVSGSGNFLSLINPNDIESMTILKDASSTAIYGSRASNGVIIITTKKSRNQGVKVSFQTTNSISTKTRTSDMLSTDEFIDVVKRFGTERQISLLGDSRTDWNDQIFHTAFGTDNNLSVSGRISSWLPYRVSVGAFYQEGILKTDNTKRFTGNINLSPSFLNNELRFQVGVKGTYSRNRFADSAAIWGGATLNPTIPVYSGEEAFGGYTEAIDNSGNPVTGAVPNALGRLEQYNSTSDVWRVIGNIDADWSIRWVKGLRLHVTGGYDWSHGQGHVYIPAEAYLNYAEADAHLHNGVTTDKGTDMIKKLQDRANVPETHQSEKYSLADIRDQWAKEYWFEGRRRMDLVRLNSFGGNNKYYWEWKGNAATGQKFSETRNIFGIPSADLTNNTNLKQNDGY